MASKTKQIPSTKTGEIKSSTSLDKKLPKKTKEVEQVVDTPPLSMTTIDEDKKEQVEEEPSASTPIESEEKSQSNDSPPTTSDLQEEKLTSIPSTEINNENIDTTSQEEKLTSIPSTEINEENLDTKSQEEKLTSIPSQEINKENIDTKSQEKAPTSSKSRSVNFTSPVDDAEVPKSRSASSTNTRSSSSKSSRRPVDFVDTLVESYRLETSNNLTPIVEEKKYVPKTNRSRLNPNWREHRTRRLMNKLEELSLWDREEELKATQAQSLREQKWEQIQDRQRNHDLCLNLMRQRHESEMESAVLLDRGATGINDENTTATIARAMNLASPANVLAYDIPTPPQTLRRRAKQAADKTTTEFKTPLGRYRQFETNMTEKQDKINQKLQPDLEIMRAYSPYHTSIPATAVPLFSETYTALLSIPDTHSSNKYNQYHYGVASYLHQPQHAASPDYETRLRSYSNRDVRVPLKEQANDYSYYDDDNTDDYNRSSIIDRDHHKKYRSNQIDDDYHPKYRSSHIDDDHYTKHRSNPIDDDHYTKYRSNPIDDDHYTKYRSNPIDDDYHPKYRSSHIDDDHYTKYRSNPSDDDHYTKYRANPIEDDYYSKYRSSLSSRLSYSPPRRTTSSASATASSLYDYTTVANTPREYSLIHSRQPLSNSIHQRSLNDDLNAITRYSTETSKKILQNIGDSPSSLPTKNRASSSSSSTTRNVAFHDQDDDNEYLDHNHSSRNYSSKTMNQPVEILSLSSTR